MANVLHKTTLAYLQSVNTPDYDLADWLINPVLPDCDPIYWVIDGDTVREMTAAEKAVVDAALALAEDRAAILAQLAALDVLFDARVIEDLILGNPVTQEITDVIAQKVALRAQLAALDG